MRSIWSATVARLQRPLDALHFVTSFWVIMNTDQIQGSFEQVKGKAKQLWGQLTEDDFKKAEGSSDKLYGIIQQRFGDTKEIIQSKLSKLHL
jgi:uncharacterized protein YjbJ (UPF0337 family)